MTDKYAPSADGYFTSSHQVKARAYWEIKKIIDLYDRATITVANQLSYSPGSQTADVFVPSTYNLQKPVGIYIHVNSGDSARLPDNFDAILEKNYLIGASPDRTGNNRHDPERIAHALDLATTLKAKYKVDDSRVYVGGMSGGALISSLCGMLYPDMFKGIIPTEHVMQKKYWSKIYTLAEMYEMASNGQRWSHILGDDSYAYWSLAPSSTSWKYNLIVDRSGSSTILNYNPFFDTYNQIVPGMTHTNAAPNVFEKSLLFVDAPSQSPRATTYEQWEKYAFRLDDPETVFLSYDFDDDRPVAGDPTINHLPGDDFDNDGTSNWKEYLINTNPMIAKDAPATPFLTTSGTQALLNYRSGALDQQVVIHTSTDLENWDTTGNGAQMIDNVPKAGEALGTTRFGPAPASAGEPRFFYKAVITREEP